MREWLLKKVPALMRIAWTLVALFVGGLLSFAVKLWNAKEITDAYIDHRASIVFEANAAPVRAVRTEQFSTIDHRLSNLERASVDSAVTLGRIEGRMDAFIEASKPALSIGLHKRTR